MSSKSLAGTLVSLLFLAIVITVHTGCQQTTVEASHGPLGVENSTAAAASDDDSEWRGAKSSNSATQPPIQVQTPEPVTRVTVPARTILVIELDKTLSSHTSQVGEKFVSSLVQDVTAGGRIALPRGSVIRGRVTEAKPAKRVGGRARLSLEFHSVELPDGRMYPLEVQFAEAGKSQTTKDAAIIGGSTLGGAAIGHAVNKGEGTAIGAIVGGLAGAAVANETRAKPVVVNSGTILTLEMIQPLTMETVG